MADKETKSDKFRRMFDEGLSIAQISRATGDYYSFVHRVIRRHEEDKLQQKGDTNNDG